jgi:cobalt-zinc-cadmium efflux system protein
MICNHSHEIIDYNRAFVIGIVLNLSYVIVELTYGNLANSVALITDAVHNATDVMGLLVAWIGSILARVPASQNYTYGLQGGSILAAVINGVIIVLAMGTVFWEAITNVGKAEPVTQTVIIVAGIGIVINTITALLFFRDIHNDLNRKAAFLHMAADAGLSLGVVIAGINISLTGWLWYDSFISLLFVGLILNGVWDLLEESLTMALQGVPKNIELLAVRTYLLERPGVSRVYDLHIWAVSTTSSALTARLMISGGYPGDDFLLQTRQELHNYFGIEYSTLQIETGAISNYLNLNLGLANRIAK